MNPGDLAEYRGKVKALAARRCTVMHMPAWGENVHVTFRNDVGTIIWRRVKFKNLKRLGGGGNT